MKTKGIVKSEMKSEIFHVVDKYHMLIVMNMLIIFINMTLKIYIAIVKIKG